VKLRYGDKEIDRDMGGGGYSHTQTCLLPQTLSYLWNEGNVLLRFVCVCVCVCVF